VTRLKIVAGRRIRKQTGVSLDKVAGEEGIAQQREKT
jgi:hypothetical protein